MKLGGATRLSDEPVERRKMLSKALPYFLNAFWQAHTAMSPVGLASAAIDQYQKIEKDLKDQQEEITNLFADFGQLDLMIEGMSRLSLSLSRDQLLALIGNYLCTKFVRETNGNYELVTKQEQNGFDGVLYLPSRSVFVKLCKTSLQDGMLEQELETAKSLNPSELWIFSFNDHQRMDIKLDPVFAGENKVLRGRLRVIPVADLFKEISGGKFTAYTQSSIGDDEKARFILHKNTQLVQ